MSIDANAISSQSTQTLFDFSNFEIADVSVNNCRFDIHRRNKQTGEIEADAMVDGSVSIEAGTLVFGAHAWHSGGMADESYLTNEANLPCHGGRPDRRDDALFPV